MAVVNGVGTAKKVRDVYMQGSIADNVVMVILQFLVCARPWLTNRLEDTPDYNPRMIKSGRGVLLVLSTESTKRA